jgi:hypothetical protein
MLTHDNTDFTTITCGVSIDHNDEPIPSQPASPRYGATPRGRPTRRDKAASQQYLTPYEEKALLEYVLRMDERGYPLPVKFLGSIACNQASALLRFPNPCSRRWHSLAGQELATSLL